MSSDRLAVAVVTCLAFALSNLSTSAADKLCYACNSYMSQCQHPTLQAGTANVFQARCSGKCFTRQGEDDAIYRGCFDAFKAVKQLTEDYVGCRNQTWNNRVRRWCLCDTDLCNIHAVDDAAQYARQSTSSSSSSQHSTLGQSASSSSSFETQHLITPHQPQHQQLHQQPQHQQPLQPTRQYFDVVQALKQSVNSDVIVNNNNNNTSSQSSSGVSKDAELNTVWNSWHVDLTNNNNNPHNRPPSPPSIPLPGPPPAPPASPAAATSGYGPTPPDVFIDGDDVDGGSEGGVLHSIHNHQQPTRSYAGTEVFRIRQHPVRAPAAAPQLAKSNDINGDFREGEEPLDGASVETGSNYTSPVAAASAGSAESSRERFERMLQNSDTMSDVTGQLDNSTVNSDEDLEYPYNQNVHHSIEWAPVEYVDQPAPVQRELDGGVTTETTPPQTPPENVDYPYNQDRQPFIDLTATDNTNNNNVNNYADYSPVFKEAPADEVGEGDDVSEQPEVLEKTLDYPYNQLLVPDIFGNPTSLVHDKKKGIAAVEKTILDTVHSPHHQALMAEGPTGAGRRHHHHQQQQQQQQLEENETSPRPRDATERHQGPRGVGPSPMRHRSAPVPLVDVDATPEPSPSPLPLPVGPVEIAPLKTKDKYALPSADAAMTSHYQRPIGRQGGEPRVEAKEGDDGIYYENMDNVNGHLNQQIVPQIRCSHTGYYQNPKDCTQFVACLFDHNTRTKVLHLMRCPSGLVWDNFHKLCMETSSTCREGLTQANLDNNYFQFFADVSNDVTATTSGANDNTSSSSNNVNIDQQKHVVVGHDVGLLNDIKHKHDDAKQF